MLLDKTKPINFASIISIMVICINQNHLLNILKLALYPPGNFKPLNDAINLISVLWLYSDCYHGYNHESSESLGMMLRFMKTDYH